MVKIIDNLADLRCTNLTPCPLSARRGGIMNYHFPLAGRRGDAGGEVEVSPRLQHFRTITAVLFFFLLTFPVLSQTSLSGDISGLTFSPSANPYLVKEDLLVPEGKTVTIPKGCVFLFGTMTGLKVEGALIVQGTTDSPAVFTSINDISRNRMASRTPDSFDWNGIFVAHESRGSRLEHCLISYSVYGITSLTRDLFIDSCLFRSNGEYNFRIIDEVLTVTGDVPFSWGNPEKVADPAKSVDAIVSVVAAAPTPAPVPSVPQATAKPPLHHAPFYKSKPFRITTAGVGVVGVGVGIFGAINASRHQTVLDDISAGKTARVTIDRWNEMLRQQRQSEGACIAGFVLGALGIAGFSISIALPDK